MGRRSREKSGVSPNRDEKTKKSVYFTIIELSTAIIGIIMIVAILYFLLRVCDGKEIICATTIPWILKKIDGSLEAIRKIFESEPPIPKKLPIETVSYIWLIAVKPALAKALLLFGLS